MKINLKPNILSNVEKPSRYTGGEWNMIRKNPDNVDIRFAFCFPDIYEIGMSHLGMRILYHLLNKREDTYCERAFAPWTDMEELMRREGISLFSLETKHEIKTFDFIGFTLQYEMSYTNILNMLDLSGVPLFSRERDSSHPFVCAGGPCAYNPEPLAEFIDFFMLGEGEELINEVMDVYKEWKKDASAKENRNIFLKRLAQLEGVYVPAFYHTDYNDDGTIRSFKPVFDGVPEKIRKRIVKDMENVYFPEDIIVPFTGIVHDRIMLELFRGCIRGCRFCQAGYIYRPVRERSPEALLELASKLVKNTGYEEISLSSLSTSDYSGLEKLAEGLVKEMESQKVSISLPSLRLDSFSLELMKKVKTVRKSGLTFAPEAGTQRLRDVINKNITQTDLESAVSLAFNGGWSSVKLYFMIGLPTETFIDMDGIVNMTEAVASEYYRVPKEKRAKGLEITVSASTFVPKPFTPFQWEAQESMESLGKKQQYLKEKLKNRYTRFNWHDTRLSLLEAVFARGDRKLSKVLYSAYKKGCKFDAWGERFNFGRWQEAFDECGVSTAFYANRQRDEDEILPWSFIDTGVTGKFLANEREKAYKEMTTPNCRDTCVGCGAITLDENISICKGGN